MTRKLVPYLLIAPALILVAAVLIVPLLRGIWISLHEVDILQTDSGVFVGLANYREVLTDTLFHNSIARTTIFALGTVTFGLIFSMVSALVLFSLRGGAKSLQALALVPFFVSAVATAITWRFLFNTDSGIINNMLALVGVDGPSWLGHPTRALVVIILAQVWALAPLATLILLGGLQVIDPNMLEAAEIDGASSFQRFRHVVLPGIRPQVSLALVWLTFASFATFGVILPLTGGGPGRSTEVMALFMYNRAFQDLNLGSGAVVMVALLVITTALSWLYIRLSPSSLIQGNPGRS